MTDILIKRLIGWAPVIDQSGARPTIRYRAEVETETGPLILQVTATAAQQLAAALKDIPPIADSR